MLKGTSWTGESELGERLDDVDPDEELAISDDVDGDDDELDVED